MEVGPKRLAFRQLVRGHLRDQVLEGAPVAEQPEVGERAGGKESAQQVEGFGTGRRLPRPVGLALFMRELLADRVGHRLHEPAVGCEQGVGRGLVVGMRELCPPVVQEPAVRTGPVEAHVAGRLLEGRDPDPAVLQRLGGQGRDLLDGDMRARELGHRVVAVADEHALVELLRPADGDHVVVGCRRGQAVEARLGLVDELVEQHAAEALLGAGVAGEQSALDHLGQVAEREDRPVEVGEVPPEEVRLDLGKLHGSVFSLSPLGETDRG